MTTSEATIRDDEAGPRRVQLSRAKGWRMPENTVKVDRSTRWGNHFRVLACEDGSFEVRRNMDELWNAPEAVSESREGAIAAAEALDGAEADAIADGDAIGFNARYALDALRSLPGDAVEVRMSSPGDPMLWRNPAEAGALWVVMPLRV